MAKLKKSSQPQERSAKAVVKYLRIAPRKVRIVIDTIRYKHPETALDILSTLNKKAARFAEKLVKSAIANAKVLGMDESRLMISDIRADGGPVMKRFMERSMGRADRIIKRTTHLSVILTEGGKKLQSDATKEAAAEKTQTSKAVKTEKAAAKPKKKAAAAKA